MHCAELAEAYNLNGLTQVTVASMQEEDPGLSEWLFSQHGDAEGVSADGSEEIGLYREQPECHAILGNLQPRCSRYFYSSCRYCLYDLCEPFLLRYLLMFWKDDVDEAIASGSGQARLNRLNREDDVAATEVDEA